MTRILLVDDDEDLRSATRSLLEASGYEVVEADDGRKALALYRANPTDLVVTDIVMADVEGLAMIRELRRSHPDAKIIALSGSDNAGHGKYLEMARHLGAKRTFTKPVENETLLDAVRQLIA